MIKLHVNLMRCSSIAAIGASSLLGIFPAIAQTTRNDTTSVESVIVSGSRLSEVMKHQRQSLLSAPLKLSEMRR